MSKEIALQRIQDCLETQATELNLSNLQLTELPETLAKCTQLEVLNLYSNQLTDVSPLSGLTQLTQLYLSDNQLMDVSPLAELTGLKVLNLNDNQLMDVTQLAHLTECNIYR